LNGDRLKIAVFIDFDNIEIGVKSTLNRHFDVGTVLEAIKERGEVVTKVAYGDWKRAGDHSRSMTQHAIQMVQRNLTPGGDKNGADINLALDALEMAFTRNHINAFVIVGGDSDFMALVEKLKQYDKKVLVVGGRSFTSVILQKNCHEFIAYENLIAPQASARRPAERTRVVEAGDSNLAKAFPLIRRALKVLSDREVSPQLGLLKSTLLQLDSTFTERDYGASTFRDFIEKLAAAGYVNLKQVDRSLLVELKDGESALAEEEVKPEARQEGLPVETTGQGEPGQAPSAPPVSGPTQDQIDEAVRTLQEVFKHAKVVPHWPMYLRNVKQYVKNAAPTFDERRYGFATFLEAVRAGQRAGLFRLERNRQGILRVFPGNQFPHRPATPPPQVDVAEVEVEVEEVVVQEPEIIEAAPVREEPIEEPIQVTEAEPIVEAMDAGLLASEPVDAPTSGEFSLATEEKTPRKRRAPAKRKPATGATGATGTRPRSSAPRRSSRKKPETEPAVE
jgi:uncharacterized protein (TIGR00288 family)